MDRFLASIDRSLHVACSVDTVLRIAFSHDVFRYLFNDKTELTLKTSVARSFLQGGTNAIVSLALQTLPGVDDALFFP